MNARVAKKAKQPTGRMYPVSSGWELHVKGVNWFARLRNGQQWYHNGTGYWQFETRGAAVSFAAKHGITIVAKHIVAKGKS